MRTLLLAAALIASGMTAAVAEAKTWAAGGFLFSDEMGGFTILSVTGRGTVAEPIVIVEELTDIGPAILVIRIDKSDPPPSGSQLRPSFVNAALVKIVTNASKRVWVGFDLELRQDLRKPSPYGDGLSFDQMGSFSGLMARADSFTDTRKVTEPYDRVSFENGSVDPGMAVNLSFFITDPTPVSEFYLFQEPRLLIAEDRQERRSRSLAELP